MNLNMAGGAQGMMKEGSTLADGVDEAVLKNIGPRAVHKSRSTRRWRAVASMACGATPTPSPRVASTASRTHR